MAFAVEMFLLVFWFGTACNDIMFAVAIGATISCSLGRQYKPMLSLSFLDVCGMNQFSSLSEIRLKGWYAHTHKQTNKHTNKQIKHKL
jgi:hypothetical protein